jgi:hypothetical protein
MAAAASEMFYMSRVLLITELNQTDGLHISLSTKTIIHLGHSDNAPDLHSYAKANTEIAVIAFLQQCLGKLTAMA